MDDPKIVETSQRLGSQYQVVAQKLNVAFADANPWGVEFTYDGVHFSERGHSIGGAMAANYAANHSDELDGLILLAAYSTKNLSGSNLGNL